MGSSMTQNIAQLWPTFILSIMTICVAKVTFYSFSSSVARVTFYKISSYVARVTFYNFSSCVARVTFYSFAIDHLQVNLGRTHMFEMRVGQSPINWQLSLEK